jgi:hypothetical protein
VTRAIYEPLQRAASRVSDLTTFQNSKDAHRFIAAGIVADNRTTIIPGSGFQPMFMLQNESLIRNERSSKMNWVSNPAKLS